ncbi:hypothetical protein ABIB81_008573 [Bradyrhizobium sp. I1.7.5]
MSLASIAHESNAKSRIGAILRARSGNFFGHFDFFLFGFYASVIENAFFSIRKRNGFTA